VPERDKMIGPRPDLEVPVPVAADPIVFPDPTRLPGRTTLVLVPGAGPGGLPAVAWSGPGAAVAGAGGSAGAGAVAAAAAGSPAGPAAVGRTVLRDGGTPLLPEMSSGRYSRPGLRGARFGADGAGRDWSTAFVPESVSVQTDRLLVTARDEVAGLSLQTEVESLSGGGLRARHTLTNDAPGRYLVDALEVAFAVPERVAELLDSTGGHLHERTPQRHPVADGLWLRENRRGKTGLDAATVLHAGTAGFDFGSGEVWAAHVAWSGNTALSFERTAETGSTLWGGELLLPGEVALDTGQEYATPWVHLVAVDDGLDGVAAAFHGWLRSLPAHPAEPAPVNLNVWEAVYFDHDLTRLQQLADLAAGIGVERYVLDDGWFGSRRDDTAGLGDWTVSPDAWPNGLDALVEHVTALGMVFGLWFEPEMVNPDSDLYRAHPDWVLSTGDRVPLLERGQLVLDLSRDEVRDHVLEQVSAVLSAHDIGYVKWDHNRDLLEAGTAAAGGAPAVHLQTLGFYALLDQLRARHPGVEWESCASGGGRVDLAVLARTQRIWVSDMTDALARQQIQRWTTQLVAPEYLGAHVSAPVNHQTGRAFDLDFRAATALFGSFGIEWDITAADPGSLDRLAAWIAHYREHRFLLHSGRTFRRDDPDPVVQVHGVVAADRSGALVAIVELGDSHRRLPLTVRVPGLDPDRGYRVTWSGPGASDPGASGSTAADVPPGADPAGPAGDVVLPGSVLARIGVRVRRRKPQTVTLLLVSAA